MNPFKPYLLGTVEKWPYKVVFKEKGNMFHISVYAEHENDAIDEVYRNHGNEIEIVSVEPIEF